MEQGTAAATPPIEEPVINPFQDTYLRDQEAMSSITAEEVKRAEESSFGVLEASGTAAKNTWIHNAPQLWLNSMEDDPNFKITEEMESADGVLAMPEESRDFVRKATSEQEYRYRLDILEKRKFAQEKLVNAGMAANAAYVVTEIMDLEELGALYLAGGVGGLIRTATIPVELMSAATKVAGTAEAGRKLLAAKKAGERTTTGIMLENLALSAPFELARSTYDPSYSATDAMLMLSFMTAAGTGLGKWAQSKDQMHLLAVYNRRMLAKDKDGKFIPLDDTEKEIFSPIIGDEAITIRERVLEAQLKKDASATAPKASGKVEGLDTSDASKFEDAPYQLGYGILTGHRKVREKLSVVARGMASPIGLVRKMSSALGTNFAGNADRSAVEFSALDIQTWYQDRMNGRVLPEHNKLQADFIKTNGASGGRKFTSIRAYMNDKTAFNEKITEHLRFGNQTDARVVRAAELWRKEIDEIYGDAIKHNARGFTKESNIKNYVPRVYSDEAIDNYVRANGEGRLLDKFKEALKGGQPDIDEALLNQLAEGVTRGLLKRIRQRATRDVTRKSAPFMEDSLDEVLQIMADSGMDKETLDLAEKQLMQLYGVAQDGKTGISRARARLMMDETHISDLLENDIEALATNYSFNVGGAIGLARHGIDVNNGKSFSEMLDDVIRHAQEAGMTEAEITPQVEALQFLYDTLNGAVVSRVEVKNDSFLRKLRDLNFMRVMNMTGVTSLIETANVLSEASMKTVIRSVPELGNLLKKTRSGTLSDDIAREMMHITGTGIDMFTGRVRNHFDDLETGFVDKDYDFVDNVLAHGRQVTATISGMLPVTAMLRRLDSYMYAQEWITAAGKHAKGSKKAKPYADIKLEQLGVSKDDATGIMELINKHAKRDKKGKVISLNGEDWKTSPDGERLFEVFALSARRHTLTNVQETSAGSVNRMLRSPVGKTLFQFMSYPIAGSEQQAQRLAVRAAYGDAGNVGKLLLSQGMAATMVYLGLIHARTAGMSDAKKKKYLEDAMRPSSLFWGVAGYMGALGIVPMFVSQFGNNKLLQPPIIDITSTLTRTANAARENTFGEGEWSENQLRTATRLLPYQNWYLANYFLNKTADAAGN